MKGFPKQKAPSSPKILDAWIRDKANEEGELASRIRLGIGYMVVSAVLTRADTGGTPLFVLKGGVAMQLRFRHRARSSQDLDMVFRRSLAELEAELTEAPQHPLGHFVVRPVGKAHPLGQTGVVRQPLQVTYRLQPWAKIFLEVSPEEGGSIEPSSLEYLPPSPDPSLFGLDPVEPIPCMSVAYQIAQKLHACTEVKAGKDNKRFSDLLDLQLLEELVDDWSAVRAACEEIFSLRGNQGWPPSLTVYPSWPEPYAATATENTFPVIDVRDAANRITAMISTIAVAASEAIEPVTRLPGVERAGQPGSP